MNAEQAAALRKPFPDDLIGKLPRVTCRACSQRSCNDHRKVQCSVCKAYISERHIHLDYVGHAATTDRFLQVDPDWTWEPYALDTNGLPLVKDGALWIRLTICGKTLPGVGGADGKSGTDAIKEMIGDALRNAGMRFGVALDLWSKEDLHADEPEPEPRASCEACGKNVERGQGVKVGGSVWHSTCREASRPDGVGVVDGPVPETETRNLPASNSGIEEAAGPVGQAPAGPRRTPRGQQ